MNPKIEKLNRDIEKTEAKIAELQDKLRDLKKQKTELENNELVSLCRDNGISPADLAAYLREKEKSRKADETEDNYED